MKLLRAGQDGCDDYGMASEGEWTGFPRERRRVGLHTEKLETPREDLHVKNEETDLHAEDVGIGVGSRPPAL